MEAMKISARAASGEGAGKRKPRAPSTSFPSLAGLNWAELSVISHPANARNSIVQLTAAARRRKGGTAARAPLMRSTLPSAGNGDAMPRCLRAAAAALAASSR